MSERTEAEEVRIVDQLRQFQLTKLAQNRHKGGWDSDDYWALYWKMCAEMQELHDAVMDYLRGEGSGEAVAFEAADVGNFGAMLVDLVLRGRQS